MIGEHRSARSRHESDEALEEGRGLEAKGLGAVGEGARETEEELTLLATKVAAVASQSKA